ncbi:MAG TPA: 4'-phosphopantetheinyl transferase superfamily protein [Hyphomicrobiales bacterium]
MAAKSSEMRRLAVGQVDVWLVALDAIDADRLRGYEALMDAKERERWQRFRMPKSRLIHLVARALLRTTLSLYADAAPTHWRFETNDYGRPYVAAPEIGRDLRFNLSHTDGLVVLAIAEGCEIGIDVETLDRRLDTAEIAPTVFEASELGAFQSAPEHRRRDLFFAFWTLKEAYIKARGMGVSLPLDGFAFDLSRPHPRIGFNDRCPDDASRWQFRRFDAAPEHVIAVAVEAPESAVDIRLIQTVPDAGAHSSHRV